MCYYPVVARLHPGWALMRGGCGLAARCDVFVSNSGSLRPIGTVKKIEIRKQTSWKLNLNQNQPSWRLLVSRNVNKKIGPFSQCHLISLTKVRVSWDFLFVSLLLLQWIANRRKLSPRLFAQVWSRYCLSLISARHFLFGRYLRINDDEIVERFLRKFIEIF